MSNKRAEQVLCGVSLAIVMLFACSILVRTATRQILVKRMGITNAFTDMVLFDVQKLKEEQTDKDTEIDWAALYPFLDGEMPAEGAEKQKSRLTAVLDKVTEKVDSVKSKVETYTTDYLVGYHKMVDAAKKYEAAIQWNYTSFAEYNGIVTMSDGYLTGVEPKADVSAQAESAVKLAEYCKDSGIQFLYIQAPDKISKYEDTDISDVSDFSNQNADEFLERIRASGIKTVDLREQILAENLPHHELFYRTDHHWKAETGLWASRHILRLLRDDFGFNADLDALEDEKFEAVLYPNWFLGSQGKKVTLERTTPDDFTLLYPKYQTDIHYEVLSRNIDVDGDFSVMYDMKQVEELDYYGENPYAAHIYGDQPLERIENHLIEEPQRLCIIHDSFCDCVVPFLAMGIKYVDSLDIRHFTGSVQTFIDTTQPDIVIVMYNPTILTPNTDAHIEAFDFR